jgi:micrococcal nuclease
MTALLTLVVLIVLGLRNANQPPAPQAPPNVPPNASPQEAGAGAVRVVRVVDGDTLLLDEGVRVRLLGVNTPELEHDGQPEQPLGKEAAAFTRDFIGARKVTLEYDRERVDDYGRTLAYVYVDGRMLNEALIEAGLSEAVTRHPYRSDRKTLFEKAEDRARDQGLGIWSLPARKGRR